MKSENSNSYSKKLSNEFAKQTPLSLVNSPDMTNIYKFHKNDPMTPQNSNNEIINILSQKSTYDKFWIHESFTQDLENNVFNLIEARKVGLNSSLQSSHFGVISEMSRKLDETPIDAKSNNSSTKYERLSIATHNMIAEYVNKILENPTDEDFHVKVVGWDENIDKNKIEEIDNSNDLAKYEFSVFYLKIICSNVTLCLIYFWDTFTLSIFKLITF